MYITRLASNEIFSSSKKIHREVGQAKDLSASLYVLHNTLVVLQVGFVYVTIRFF